MPPHTALHVRYFFQAIYCRDTYDGPQRVCMPLLRVTTFGVLSCTLQECLVFALIFHTRVCMSLQFRFGISMIQWSRSCSHCNKHMHGHTRVGWAGVITITWQLRQKLTHMKCPALSQSRNGRAIVIVKKINVNKLLGWVVFTYPGKKSTNTRNTLGL